MFYCIAVSVITELKVMKVEIFTVRTRENVPTAASRKKLRKRSKLKQKQMRKMITQFLISLDAWLLRKRRIIFGRNLML